MLLIKFKIGDEYYAINTDDVIEIIPIITLRPIPGTPDFFVGLFDYRGQIIPVIDINKLTINIPATMRLSTRIILLNFLYNGKKTILGLMAKDVIDVIDVDISSFQNIGVISEKAPYLDSVCEYEGKFVQLIKIDKLLSDDVQQKLFSLTNK